MQWDVELEVHHHHAEVAVLPVAHPILRAVLQRPFPALHQLNVVRLYQRVVFLIQVFGTRLTHLQLIHVSKCHFLHYSVNRTHKKKTPTVNNTTRKLFHLLLCLYTLQETHAFFHYTSPASNV